MAKNNNVTQDKNINLIGEGTVITGDVITEGNVRIDGKLTGNLRAKGKLIVGDTGYINGEISCNLSEISGNIDGKIQVNELLSLKSTSKVQGDIFTDKLAIEPGAVFTGTCDMGKKTMVHNESTKEEKEKNK